MTSSEDAMRHWKIREYARRYRAAWTPERRRRDSAARKARGQRCLGIEGYRMTHREAVRRYRQRGRAFERDYQSTPWAYGPQSCWPRLVEALSIWGVPAGFRPLPLLSPLKETS